MTARFRAITATLNAAGVGTYEPSTADLALPAEVLAARIREREPLTEEQIAAVRRRLWYTDLGRWRPRVERGM